MPPIFRLATSPKPQPRHRQSCLSFDCSRGGFAPPLPSVLVAELPHGGHDYEHEGADDDGGDEPQVRVGLDLRGIWCSDSLLVSLVRGLQI